MIPSQGTHRPLLEAISGPADLGNLPAEHTPRLTAEIREFLIQTVSQTGGHLGSNLGGVELKIAAHRISESPRDPIIFDTGHQAYAHKISPGGGTISTPCASPVDSPATRHPPSPRLL